MVLRSPTDLHSGCLQPFILELERNMLEIFLRRGIDIEFEITREMVIRHRIRDGYDNEESHEWVYLWTRPERIQPPFKEPNNRGITHQFAHDLYADLVIGKDNCVIRPVHASARKKLRRLHLLADDELSPTSPAEIPIPPIPLFPARNASTSPGADQDEDLSPCSE